MGRIDILGADTQGLRRISSEHLLSLDDSEMAAIKRYYKKLGRNPTDCEIETIAQTWSEHCVHKTFKAVIEYKEIIGGKQTRRVVTPLKEIMGVTVAQGHRWCLSVFKDNAGVIEFVGRHALAFKVETHNHPSALEPYGGAGTGIGGVIRDILGVGRGARPILNTDVFCFGPLDTPREDVPEGVLPPRRVFKGVVSGVRDYGNRMGIPTGNGAILFDRGYVRNCLVFCGTVGILPVEKVDKQVCRGDLIIVVGGRTGRDGIHGATFSSTGLDRHVPTSVVQIGNPIVEKKVLDVLLVARDRDLYHAITDCGAGGLSSAVGEMGEFLGAEVFLDRVPLKYRDLRPWEIWVSESQERMVLAVPPECSETLQALFAAEDVEATVIGSFTGSGSLVLHYGDEVVGQMDMQFLHRRLPPRRLKAQFEAHETVLPPLEHTEWGDLILQVLRCPNVASKEAVIRQYDHEVQGQTVIKPLIGFEGQGPSDAVVLKPLYERQEGVAVSCGINPWYGEIDPYHMAGCCIDEALRNLVCVGADPSRAALLDNFCWGDVSNEKELGRLVRCVLGCRDYAMGFRVPFISGKDSLHNVFRDDDGNLHSIPGTLLISAIAPVPDVRKAISSDLKQEGDRLYLCGKTMREMGGSQYYAVSSVRGGRVPRPSAGRNLRCMKKLHRAVQQGLLAACHDCSDGGLAVALSEMVIGGTWGLDIFLENTWSEDGSVETLLFSETPGRFVVEVHEECCGAFERLMKNESCFRLGVVIPEPVLKIRNGQVSLCEIPHKALEEAWKGAVTW